MIVVEISRLFKWKRSVVSGQISDGSDDHFSERRMDVEEEGPVDVPAPHLAEVGLVPAHPGWLVDLVEPRPEGERHQEREDQPFRVQLFFPRF